MLHFFCKRKERVKQTNKKKKRSHKVVCAHPRIISNALAKGQKRHQEKVPLHRIDTAIMFLEYLHQVPPHFIDLSFFPRYPAFRISSHSWQDGQVSFIGPVGWPRWWRIWIYEQTDMYNICLAQAQQPLAEAEQEAHLLHIITSNSMFRWHHAISGTQGKSHNEQP